MILSHFLLYTSIMIIMDMMNHANKEIERGGEREGTYSMLKIFWAIRDDVVTKILKTLEQDQGD